MANEILEALLRIRGDGSKPGIQNWRDTIDTLVHVEKKLLALADAGGRYGASVLAITWARRSCERSNRTQMLKALDYAIEQLEAKSAADLNALNASLLSSGLPVAYSGSIKKPQQMAQANSLSVRKTAGF